MKEKKYSRLTYEERVKIEALLKAKMSISKIAKELGRDRSSIYREIKRGEREHQWGYQAQDAEFRARLYLRTRRIESKFSQNSLLRYYVFKRLILGWSPEQIANRLQIDHPKNEQMRISHESIYKYIYLETQGKMQKRLIKLLPYNKPKRSGHSKREIYLGNIIGRVSIKERPESVEDRKEPGHWEGDLIVGKGQKSVIGTLVERTSRYTIIVSLSSRKSKHVVNAFAYMINLMPEKLRKTLTYDNGIEMAAHERFTYRTKMPVYFANPYSSWERGTNENTNGLIRRVFKKKTDFNTVSPIQLKDLQNKLNNRPRKVLGWKTPNEMIQELCA